MPRWWKVRRFDAIELVLVTAVIAVLAALGTGLRDRRQYAHITAVAYGAAQEGAWLKDRYGPDRYSEHIEEWIIRDYFQDRRDGVFVDVGANHYKDGSNTYYLESKLGWSGIAIDPQAGFAADYRKHRPRTRFFPLFVSDASDASVTFYEAEGNSLVASVDRRFSERGGNRATDPVYKTQAVSAPTVKLTDLLDRARVSNIDFLSVDVELSEPKVLGGFDIERFKPSLVCIEAHPQVRQQILDYFAAHRYVLLGRYLRADTLNLYFVPAGPAATPAPEVSVKPEESLPRR